MTLDEALALPPGVDLDREVARVVMGWDVNFTAPDLRGGRVHWRDGENGTAYLPGQWGPSENYESMSDVLRRLRQLGFYLTVHLPQDGTAEVSVLRDWANDDAPLCVETGATLPLAVCQAALRACWEGTR